jgi:polyisoprenoid-binding protein YceI
MTTSVTTGLLDGTWAVLPTDAVASFTVRKLGVIRVQGGFTVTDGTVTVLDGRPVAAAATLDATSVRTGIAKRDSDLVGKRFFHTAEHPRIRVHTTGIAPDGDSWAAATVLAVAGGETPLDLRVSSRPGPTEDTVRISITGVLDRAATPIRAPRWLIGRWVAIEVHATLRRPGRPR